MSQDDLQFMKDVDQSCQLIDGHYYISLSFKNKLQSSWAESHQSQEKINKESEFHADYKAFM